jgi:PAS domain S-box-containing protein
LVAEDEQIVALELEDRFTRMGHSVVGVVASGEEVIEGVRSLRPDLVLMDIKLQGELDGVDAAEAIRREVDVPIVYLTAFADDTTLQRAKLTEPYGYILKPFHERELHVVIEVALYRHRAERALRESEAWRLAVLRSVGDAIIATGADGGVKFMNPLAEALTGWREPEAVGKPLEHVFRTLPLRERRGGPWQDAPATKLISRDGSEQPIDGARTEISDANGTPVGTVCVFRGASDRKLLQDRQRLMAVASGEVSSSLDRDMVLTKVAALLARSYADWCAVHIIDPHGRLCVAALAHREPRRSAVAPLLVGAISQDGEGLDAQAIARSGGPILRSTITGEDWAAAALGVPREKLADLTSGSAIIVPLPARGRCLGTLALVSERRGRFTDSDILFAEELGRRLAHGIDNAELYSDAQRATRMRDNVLAVVSHDLKNPLSSIRMSAEQLIRTPTLVQERVVKNASTIRRNAEHMTRLIDDLLDVGRIDSGCLSLELGRNSTLEIASEAISIFEPLAAERSIRLRASAPNLDLLCDRGRVLQLLSNLIGNALKFSPEGREITLTGEVHGEMYQMSVSDQGSGIPADQIDHVFERRWQAPEVARRGSGLGLYIAKGIVEAHGGRIWAESTPGVGSTFRFTLRIQRPDESQPTPPGVPCPAAPGGASAAPGKGR